MIQWMIFISIISCQNCGSKYVELKVSDLLPGTDLVQSIIKIKSLSSEVLTQASNVSMICSFLILTLDCGMRFTLKDNSHNSEHSINQLQFKMLCLSSVVLMDQDSTICITSPYQSRLTTLTKVFQFHHQDGQIDFQQVLPPELCKQFQVICQFKTLLSTTHQLKLKTSHLNGMIMLSCVRKLDFCKIR